MFWVTVHILSLLSVNLTFPLTTMTGFFFYFFFSPKPFFNIIYTGCVISFSTHKMWALNGNKIVVILWFPLGKQIICKANSANYM